MNNTNHKPPSRYFELSANRRDIWWGSDMSGDGALRSQWNRVILEDVVAPCYARMIHLAAKEISNSDSSDDGGDKGMMVVQKKESNDDDDFSLLSSSYSLWPRKWASEAWEVTLRRVYIELCQLPVLRSRFTNQWVQPTSCVLVNSADKTQLTVAEILALQCRANEGHDLVEVPPTIFTHLSSTEKVTTLTSPLVRRWMKAAVSRLLVGKDYGPRLGNLQRFKIEWKKGIALLDFCCSDLHLNDSSAAPPSRVMIGHGLQPASSLQKTLMGLPLMPLQDGTFALLSEQKDREKEEEEEREGAASSSSLATARASIRQRVYLPSEEERRLFIRSPLVAPLLLSAQTSLPPKIYKLLTALADDDGHNINNNVRRLGGMEAVYFACLALPKEWEGQDRVEAPWKKQIKNKRKNEKTEEEGEAQDGGTKLVVVETDSKKFSSSSIDVDRTWLQKVWRYWAIAGLERRRKKKKKILAKMPLEEKKQGRVEKKEEGEDEEEEKWDSVESRSALSWLKYAQYPLVPTVDGDMWRCDAAKQLLLPQGLNAPMMSLLRKIGVACVDLDIIGGGNTHSSFTASSSFTTSSSVSARPVVPTAPPLLERLAKLGIAALPEPGNVLDAIHSSSSSSSRRGGSSNNSNGSSSMGNKLIGGGGEEELGYFSRMFNDCKVSDLERQALRQHVCTNALRGGSGGKGGDDKKGSSYGSSRTLSFGDKKHEKILKKLPIFQCYVTPADDRMHNGAAAVGVYGKEEVETKQVAFRSLETTKYLPPAGVMKELLQEDFVMNVLPMDQVLVESLGVRRMGEVEFYRKYVVERFDHLDPSTRKRATLKLLSNLSRLVLLPGGPALRERLKVVRFLTNAKNESKLVTDLYDPEVALLRSVLASSSWFPTGAFATREVLVTLRDLGLRTSLDRHAVLVCATHIAAAAAAATNHQYPQQQKHNDDDMMTGERKKTKEEDKEDGEKAALGLSNRLLRAVDIHIDKLISEKDPASPSTPSSSSLSFSEWRKKLVTLPWLPVFKRRPVKGLPWPPLAFHIDDDDDGKAFDDGKGHSTSQPLSSIGKACLASAKFTRPMSDQWLVSVSMHILDAEVRSEKLRAIFGFDQPVPATVSIYVLV
eukprot:jgi/Bigna1/134998/aug1.27_g9706